MQQIQLLTSPPSPGPEEQTELVQVSTELQKGSSRLWCNVQHPAIWWQVRVQHFPWDILGELGLIRGDIICIIWYLKKYFKKYIYITNSSWLYKPTNITSPAPSVACFLSPAGCPHPPDTMWLASRAKAEFVLKTSKTPESAIGTSGGSGGGLGCTETIQNHPAKCGESTAGINWLDCWRDV